MAPNSAAVLVNWTRKPFVVQTVDERYPDDNEVVIKNHAVAMNNIDRAIQDEPWEDFKYPLILGVDVAGEVVEIGSLVTRFKVGDRVLGHALSFATKDDRHAGFQSYTVLMENMACPIPSFMPYESAAVFPLGVSTAAAALFQDDFLKIGKPRSKPERSPKTVLIWGGTSAVGSNAIQLAVAAGCQVIATASKTKIDFVKNELGATDVKDYTGASIVTELQQRLKNEDVIGAFDAIGNKQSTKATMDVIRPLPGGKKPVVATNWYEGDEKDMEGVEFSVVQAVDIRNNDVGNMVYRDFLPEALQSGRYKVMPEPKIVGEGIEGIQAGLDSSAGLSAQKGIVTIK